MRLAILILLAACTDTSSTSKDTGTPPDLDQTINGVFVAADFNRYEANGDYTEFTLVGTEEAIADYAIDGVASGRKTPDYVDGLSPEVHTATYTYNVDGATYIGSGSNDVSEIADLSGNLCADLSGTWDLVDEYNYNPYSAEATVNGCNIQLEGIAVGNNWATVDGNMLVYEFGYGYVKLIVSDDGTTMTGRIYNSDSGSNYIITGTRR